MPGKCFPLSFSQQIFALKGNVCSASGCGTAAASTGWGPRDPALGPGVDTAHTHTSTRRGHLGSPGGGAGHRDKRGHGPLGALQLPQRAQKRPRDRWVERLPEPGSAPRSRRHPAESLRLPGRCLRPQPGHQGPARRMRLQTWVALCSAHPRASAHGRTVHCAPAPLTRPPCLCSRWHIWLGPATPRRWQGWRAPTSSTGAGARGARAGKPPTAPPLRLGTHSSLPRGPSHGRSGRGAEEVGAMQGRRRASCRPAQGCLLPRAWCPRAHMSLPGGWSAPLAGGARCLWFLGDTPPRRNWASAP